MIKIGNVEIKGKVVLAPMAGICNSAFRKIIKEQGAALIYAEMVSDKAIFYKNNKTREMLFMEEIERPITQQIFGSDVETFVEAAKFIEKEMKHILTGARLDGKSIRDAIFSETDDRSFAAAAARFILSGK